MKKNGILTLKNEILKHAEFASEWRKSRFRGLKTRLLGRRLRRTPFIELPLLKTWIRARKGKRFFYGINKFASRRARIHAFGACAFSSREKT